MWNRSDNVVHNGSGFNNKNLLDGFVRLADANKEVFVGLTTEKQSVCWQPLSEGRVMFNVDGVIWVEVGKIGVGAVIRNYHG